MSWIHPAGAPVVTVVVIFWNAEPFLEEAIESVLAQTFQRWELLLVDDGSDDESTAIARRYVTQDPGRVRYLEHPGHENRGMSASRNLGLHQARGELVAFLDADDAWFPNALEDQVRILEENPRAVMVYGPIQYWHSWTGEPEDEDLDRIEALGVPPDSIVEPPGLLVRFLQDKAAVPSGLLVRRRSAEVVGGFEDAFRGEYEDQVFLAKVCLREPVLAAGTCWYRYRQHDRSAVAVGLSTGTTDTARTRFLDWLEGYLRAQGVTSPEVWRALRMERWRFTRPRTFHWLRRSERAASRLVQRFRGAE
jgi:glycosyltransferase involved in cell wall biosynthesis